MKIRILGNSIRLRLSQTEVKQLSEQGSIREETCFFEMPSDTFVYSLEKNAGEGIGATFQNGHIRVFVNDKMTNRWANSDQVSMEQKRSLTNDNSLRILIEKDFKCLTERDEDESDLFPHPTNC